ncbi:hypothetical protein M408DRAFT_285158 [Serendipita vermifera MAFF 305830]|uniref:Uncharacterized protein n=1 Tax=Serendipita vermifera MAFF 305830 TaxID=933852 RepID=A0A0C3BE39_SERVB|nr:hypothetical protein M408DRAFT_285158 [Serendipita vermifera MAFF 305830]
MHPTCGHYNATKVLAILDCSQRQCRLSTAHPRHCHPCRCERYYGPDDERNRGKAAGYCPDCVRQSEMNARSRQ